MTLREPPKKSQAANLVGRFAGLVMLLGLFAVVIWTVATNQQAAAIQRSDPLVHAPGQYVDTPRGALHVVTVGEGSVPMVAIHHDTIAGGAPLVPLASELAERDRRVILPDLLSYGFSPRPVSPGRRLSTTGQAESVAELLDELGEAPYEVVGFGEGGEVATELAVLRPDLTSRLVLVDTPDLPVPSDGVETLEGLPFGVGEAVAYTYDGAAPGALQRFQDECPSWAHCEGEVLEHYRRASAVPGTAEAIHVRRASDPAFVAPSRLDEISVDVLVVAVGTSREEAANLAERFPQGEAQNASASELADVLAG
ncbi:MAG: alpha/beta fold hydrolase [Actinomycetota bacterium]